MQLRQFLSLAAASIAVCLVGCVSLRTQEVTAINRKSNTVEHAHLRFPGGEVCGFGILIPNAKSIYGNWPSKITGPAVFWWNEDGERKTYPVHVPVSIGRGVIFEILPSDTVEVSFDEW